MKFKQRLKIIEEILKDTQYDIIKKTIKELFKKTNSNSKDDIILRLIVIDSSYSTNMNRRYFGFEELTDLIYAFKSELKENINVKYFIEKYFDKIMKTPIGINKRGDKKGHSFSLLTKYIYYETNFNFPIYDSLVLKELNKEFKGITKFAPTKDYFFKLIELKEEYNTTFDELDKYYWFIGKVKGGNLSLLIPNSKIYTDEFVSKLLTNEERNNKEINSSKLDLLMAKKLKYNVDFFENKRLQLVQQLAREL